MVWFAPTPRSSGGRSAVSSSSGTPGVVRLERGRQQVRRRGAGRADHGRRHPRLASDAERGEPGDPLVDAHVQADDAAALELGGDEGERLRARSGAQDDVPDAELDERAEEGGCGIRRRRARVGAVGRSTVSRRRRAEPRASSSPSSADGAALAAVSSSASACRSVPRVGRRGRAGCGAVAGVAGRRPGRPARIVVFGVELRELLFEAADALVLVAERADLLEELGVVVGRAARGDRASGARARR